MTEPKMGYTRSMAIVAFIYALFYIWRTPEPAESVLWFLGAIIAFWALGRATVIEVMQIWKGK